MRAAAAPATHPLPPPLPSTDCDCTCPTDFACADCGYGVAQGHLPYDCPMCGGHRWRPIGAHGARSGSGPARDDG